MYNGVFVDDRVQLVLWYPVPHPEKSGQYPDITGGTGVFPVETAPTASKRRGVNPRSQKENKNKKKKKNCWSII